MQIKQYSYLARTLLSPHLFTQIARTKQLLPLLRLWSRQWTRLLRGVRARLSRRSPLVGAHRFGSVLLRLRTCEEEMEEEEEKEEEEEEEEEEVVVVEKEEERGGRG